MKSKKRQQIAAGAPDSGQSFADWWKDYAPAPGAAEIKPYGEGYVALTPDGVRKHFVQEIPSDEGDIVYATQGPLAVKCFGDKITEAAWRSKPNWYIVATNDQTIPPAVERDSASRMGATTLVLESSHVPMLRCRGGIHREGGGVSLRLRGPESPQRRPPMSHRPTTALRQQRPVDCYGIATSAFHPTSDIVGMISHVRKVQQETRALG